MKQLVGMSTNILYNAEKEQMVETIFMIHEPDWEIINDQTIKRSKLTTLRVVNKVATLKKMFTEFVKELDEIKEIK